MHRKNYHSNTAESSPSNRDNRWDDFKNEWAKSFIFYSVTRSELSLHFSNHVFPSKSTDIMMCSFQLLYTVYHVAEMSTIPFSISYSLARVFSTLWVNRHRTLPILNTRYLGQGEKFHSEAWASKSFRDVQHDDGEVSCSISVASHTSSSDYTSLYQLSQYSHNLLQNFYS